MHMQHIPPEMCHIVTVSSLFLNIKDLKRNIISHLYSQWVWSFPQKSPWRMRHYNRRLVLQSDANCVSRTRISTHDYIHLCLFENVMVGALLKIYPFYPFMYCCPIIPASIIKLHWWYILLVNISRCPPTEPNFEVCWRKITVQNALTYHTAHR